MKSLLSLTFFILSVSACPDGWISAGGSCYFMSPENMNWETAQQVKILRIRVKLLFYFCFCSVLLGSGRLSSGGHLCWGTTSAGRVSPEWGWLLAGFIRHPTRRLDHFNSMIESPPTSLLQACSSGRRAGWRRTSPTGTPTSLTARSTRTVSSSSLGLTRQTSGTTCLAPLWGKGHPSSTLSVRCKCSRRWRLENLLKVKHLLCQIFSYKI